MQLAKVQSTSFTKNRAGVEILTVVAEIRKDQNVTAEYINPVGELSTPVIGDTVVFFPREQSVGGYFAWGWVDVVNLIQAARGVKILAGRDSEGKIQTRITLTDLGILIESVAATIDLENSNILLNAGGGDAVEHSRLQAAFDDYTQTVLLPEFQKVAAGTEPNPAAPYVPSSDLPIDISASKSETIKLP